MLVRRALAAALTLPLLALAACGEDDPEPILASPTADAHAHRVGDPRARDARGGDPALRRTPRTR